MFSTHDDIGVVGAANLSYGLWFSGRGSECKRTGRFLLGDFVFCCGAGYDCGGATTSKKGEMVWASVQDAEQGHFSVM